MKNEYLDLAVDFVIFLAGLSLLIFTGDSLLAAIEEMTEALIK